MKHFLLLLALLPAAAGARVVPLDRIVAVVNDDVITATELDHRLAVIKRQLARRNTRLPADDVLRRQLLERMIQERLQLQLARSIGIRVDDETLTTVLSRIARDSGMDLHQFRRALEADGFDFAEFRENVRNEIIIDRLRQQRVERRISVTEQEIKNQLERLERDRASRLEYRLAHILISLPEGAGPDAVAETRRRAEAVLARLRGGADFAAVAAEVSDGQKALEGGDLGWRRAGQLPPAFAAAVEGLAPGEVSGLIRSASGFHILKLVDKRRGGGRHVVEQTLARHILIRTDAVTSDEQARNRLAELRRRILAGEDFGELARRYSQDKASAAEGGSLGWTEPGRLVPRFEKAMQALAPGQISEPFRTRFGWHIVQVMARRQQDLTDEMRRREARLVVRKRKTEEAVRDWLRRLRDEAYVEVRLDE